MNHHRENMLAELGIGPLWKLRQEASTSAPPLETSAFVQTSSRQDDKVSALDPVPKNVSEQILNIELNKDLKTSACPVCGFFHPSDTRANDAISAPSSSVKCLFIYENIVNSDEVQVDALHGTAEELFNNMLRAVDMQRGVSASFARIVKTKPAVTGDMQKKPREIVACVACLQTQIEASRPPVIISLGKTAAISLLGLDSQTTINELRGRLQRYDNRPLIVTYDPEYVLSHPKEKSSVWSDLCLAMNAIAS